MEKLVTVIIPVYNQEDLVIRALDSIPKRDDIEIIVINDGSTDNTWNNLNKYKNSNLILVNNEKNKGVSYTVNKGYDLAKGKYIVLLGSDDYFYTEVFEEVLKELDGTDLIYFNLETNDGTVFHVNENTKTGYCGSVKFMKRTFIGNTRCPLDKKAGEDYIFYQELLKKKPTEKFTGKIVKHYNYPRQGSLFDNLKKGLIK